MGSRFSNVFWRLRHNTGDLHVVGQIKAGAMTGRQNQIAASMGDGLNSSIVADD
jgi:hypothetical protein